MFGFRVNPGLAQKLIYAALTSVGFREKSRCLLGGLAPLVLSSLRLALLYLAHCLPQALLNSRRAMVDSFDSHSFGLDVPETSVVFRLRALQAPAGSREGQSPLSIQEPMHV